MNLNQLRVGLQRRRSSGPANISTTFGALTAAGAGGVSVSGTSIDSGDASGHWQISTGKLSPSSTGDTANLNAGPYTLTLDNGQTVDITIEADTYTVVSSVEANAAFTDIGASGGKAVKFRAGTNTGGTTRIGTGLTFAAPVTLTGETGAIVDPQLHLQDVQNVVVDGLEVYDPGGTLDSTDRMLALFGDCADITIQNCHVHGAHQDLNGDYTTAGAYDNPSGIYFIANGNGYPHSATIRQNLIEHTYTGISTLTDGTQNGDLAVEYNVIRYTYTDAMLHSEKDGNPTAGTVRRWEGNVVYDCLGIPSDADNPHVDLLQFAVDTSARTIEGAVIRQNTIFETGAARGRDLQGIFSGGNQTLKDPIIAGNIIATSSNHAISIYYIDGGTVVNNTCVHPSATYDTTGNAAIKLGLTSGAGTVYVHRNAAESFDLQNATFDQSDNTTLGVKGATVAYTTAFDAPSLPATDWSEIKTEWNMKASGPLDLGGTDAGALGSGYGVYGTEQVEAGWSFDSAYEVVAYTANAVDNGGSVYGTTSSFSGPAASKEGTLSLWFYFDDTSWTGTTQRMLYGRNGTSNRMILTKISSGRIGLYLYNGSGVNILSAISPTSTFAHETWHHLLISWDLANSTFQMYVDDSSISVTPSTITDDTVGQIDDVQVFSGPSGGNIWTGFYSDVYVDYDTHLDLSSEPNRRNFIDASGKPVDISSYGSPHLLLTGDENDFFTNQGSGGDLTETGGSLSAAASSPSD